MVALTRMLRRIGIESKMPPELMFLQNFYQTQSLSAKKLKGSSFVDPDPQVTIFTELPMLIQYYLTRWENLNLIASDDKTFFDPSNRADSFMNNPEQILASLKNDIASPFLDTCTWPRGGERSMLGQKTRNDKSQGDIKRAETKGDAHNVMLSGRFV